MSQYHIVPPVGPEDPHLALWMDQVSRILSEAPVYGGMLTNDGAAEISGLGASAVTLGGFNEQMPTQDVSVSTVDGTMTIEIPGSYMVVQQSSFTGVAQNEYHAHLNLNGSETTLGWHRKIGQANDVGSASCLGMLDFVQDDYLVFKAEITSGAGDVMALEDAQFFVYRVK